MEIDRATLTILWVTSLVLPFLIFAIHNSFNRWWLTLLRAIIAVCVGWLFAVAYVTAADAINRSFSVTPTDGDGAKFAFASVFGWVLPTIIVGVSWVIYAVVLPRVALTLRSRGTPQKRGAP